MTVLYLSLFILCYTFYRFRLTELILYFLLRKQLLQLLNNYYLKNYYFIIYAINTFLFCIYLIFYLINKELRFKKTVFEKLNWNTFQTQPYGMLKKSSSIITGNDRYEDFAIDIIQEMSKMLGFNYTFEVQIDKAYGSFNDIIKKWDGMLGKIIAGVSRWNILRRFDLISRMYHILIPSISFASSAAIFHRIHNARATRCGFLHR